VTVNKRRHVWTGRPHGAPRGNAHAFKTGFQSAAFFARRKEVNAVLRSARRVIRDLAADSGRR
jgi:hypothetical protein